jgi:hypothetical protein
VIGTAVGVAVGGALVATRVAAGRTTVGSRVASVGRGDAVGRAVAVRVGSGVVVTPAGPVAEVVVGHRVAVLFTVARGDAWVIPRVADGIAVSR